MAMFNLNDYETVEQRIKRALEAHPDLRIITEDYSTDADRAVGVWRVRAAIYLDAQDQERACPKAIGHAFEIDGVGMSQKVAALETCETSAIGRALANMGFSGNKRASREEMEKVERGAPKVMPPKDLNTMLANVANLDDLQKLYDIALADGWVSDTVREQFTARKNELKK